MQWAIVGVWWAMFASLVVFRGQIEARMGDESRTTSKVAVLTAIAAATVASLRLVT